MDDRQWPIGYTGAGAGTSYPSNITMYGDGTVVATNSDRLYLGPEGVRTDAETGVKYDDGKLPWHLLSVCAMEEMLAVLQHGEKKYRAHNWRLGFKWSRLLSAACRHLFAYLRGEDRDPETGRLHTAHLMCCAMFLTEHALRKLGTDDRYKE